MEKPSYPLGTPLYEKTQGAESNKRIIYWYIGLGLFTACLWVFLALQRNTPPLITVSTAVTTVLIFDRAVWTICHACKKSTVTDAPDAHSFERTALFLYILIVLITKSSKWLGNKECGPKPVTGTILNNGKAIIVEDTGDNTLDFCDFIQNDASSTLMWALCTVPLLLLLGAGWKTLKATRKSDKKEVVWLPFSGSIGPLLWWTGKKLFKIVVSIIVLLAIFVLRCLLWSSDLLKQLRSRFQ